MTVLLLNGTSSSGKSSIARALCAVLPTPWFLLSIDAFGEMRSAPPGLELSDPEIDDLLRRTRAGFHRAVAGMAAAGNDIIVDHVLTEPWRLADLLTLLADEDVVLVGVHCDPTELARRERTRGDRTPGQAVAQLATVHAHGDYDLTVDSTTASPAELAVRIAAHLAARPPGPSAFARLRRRRTAGA